MQRLSSLPLLSDSLICSLSIGKQKSLWGTLLDIRVRWGWWSGLAEEGTALLGLSTTDFSLASQIKILFYSYTPVLDLRPGGMIPPWTAQGKFIRTPACAPCLQNTAPSPAPHFAVGFSPEKSCPLVAQTNFITSSGKTPKTLTLPLPSDLINLRPPLPVLCTELRLSSIMADGGPWVISQLDQP